MKKFFQSSFFVLGFMVLTSSALFAQESSKEPKYKVNVSGFANLTMTKDFNGSIANYDFIPSLIDMSGDTNSDDRFYIDFSTSRLNFDASTESSTFGLVELHMDVDFRGGSLGSYTPRLRRGYVSAGNFLIGKTFTNFMNVNAFFAEIDFQGPAGCCFNYSPQIRYTYTSESERLTLSASLEYLPQSLSEDVAEAGLYTRITQRYPTVPVYAQYSWGEAMDNSVRFAAICRPQHLYDVANDETISRTGWGTQISGAINILPFMRLYYSGIYGEGIAEYINDLYGSELEYTIKPNSKSGIETTPMYSWIVGMCFKLSESLSANASCSKATIGLDDRSYYRGSDYREGTFVTGNLFYNAIEDVTLGVEYVYGRRENMSGLTCDANRLYLMIRYSF